MSSVPKQAGVPDPVITRRDMMKTTTTAVGAAALGPSLYHEADAIWPAVAYAGAAVAGGAAVLAGQYVHDRYFESDPPEIDDAVEQKALDEMHSTARTMADQTIISDQHVLSEYYGTPADRTPYAKSAIDAVISATINEMANGRSENAMDASIKIAKQQTHRAVWNVFNALNHRWVGGSESAGLINHLRDTYEYGWSTRGSGADMVDWGGFEHADNAKLDPVTPNGEYEVVENTDLGDEEEYLLIKEHWNGPDILATDLSDINDGQDGDIPEEIPVYIPHLETRSGTNYPKNTLYSPVPDPDIYKDFSNHETYGTTSFDVSHNNFDTVTAIEFGQYYTILKKIGDYYEQLMSEDLPELVNHLVDSLEEGLIDPSDVTTPRQGIMRYADNEDMSYIAAVQIFTGMSTPDDSAAYRATVSHEDIVGDSLSGYLYISFSNDIQSYDVSPGTTIQPEDYKHAYIAWQKSDSGEIVERILSGQFPLEIIDAQAVDGTNTIDIPGDMDEPDNGEVPIWDIETDGEVPQWLQDSENTIIVEGDDGGISVHDPNELVTQDDTIYVDNVDLPEGESVEQVRVQPSSTYTPNTWQYDEPADITEDQVKTFYENRNQYEEMLDDLRDNGSGGGPPGVDDLLSKYRAYIIGFVAVILGLFGLNMASSS